MEAELTDMKDILSAADRVGVTLDEILSSFPLTRKELAQICSGRKEEELSNRIFWLAMAAGGWRYHAFKCNAKTLHEPVLDGQSLFDLLCESKIDTERILFAGTILRFPILARTMKKNT